MGFAPTYLVVSCILMTNLTQKILSYTNSLDEIELILSRSFKLSSQLNDCEIQYAESAIAKYKTSKFGERTLVEVKPISKDTESVINYIISQFDNAYGKTSRQIKTAVCFSQMQVLGKYQINSDLEIFPIPTGNPISDEIPSDHPFILRYSISTCNDISVNAYRSGLELDKFENLFSQLACPVKCNYGRNGDKRWVFSISNNSEVETKWQQCGYIGTNTNIENPETISSIAEVEDELYYGKYYFGAGDIMTVPKSLRESFRIALTIKKECSDKYFNAVKWYRQGLKTLQSSKGLTFIAMVTAIECLIDQDEKRAKCETCNRILDDGPTKKFNSFMETYCPGIDQSARKALYEMRSNLAHGRMVLLGDGSSYSFNPVKITQDQSLRSVIHYVRLGLRNWLHMSAKECS